MELILANMPSNIKLGVLFEGTPGTAYHTVLATAAQTVLDSFGNTSASNKVITYDLTANIAADPFNPEGSRVYRTVTYTLLH